MVHLTLAGAARAAAGAGALLGAYAMVEPLWLQLTRPRVRVRGLHPALRGLRVALLTDLHLGEGTPAWLIRRACRLAMRERPHLIAVTGDLTADHAGGFGEVLEVLSELHAPLGVYLVPGNHDHLVGIGAWAEEVRRRPGLHDLTNQCRVLEVAGARLCIVGVDDLSTGSPALPALPPKDERDLTLLLAHDPDAAARLPASAGVDLVLSGHTHGGQVRLPSVGALRTPSSFSGRFDQGLEAARGTQVYTSRGVGTVALPVRFLCRPEVAVLRFEANS